MAEFYKSLYGGGAGGGGYPNDYNISRTYATGWERKEDGKPCVTSVTSLTIILFEINFPPVSLSSEQIFCKGLEN